MNPQANLPTLLGPFVGGITASSVKIWLNVGVADAYKTVFVTLKLLDQGPKSEAEKTDPNEVVIEKVENPVVVQSGVIKCLQSDMGTGIVMFRGLEANAHYSYQLWEDEAHSVALYLGELTPADLYFWTLPEDGYGRQLDFLLMSCHNPEMAKDDGFDGFAVWHQIPEVRKANKNVRFAILCGDQLYADEVETDVLKEQDESKRKELYLRVYRKFWDNADYRRVLCSLPAILMWDDHDITDGWGSREDSYVAKDSQEFADRWKDLFQTAKEMFGFMQASRNPDPPSSRFSGRFDTCFRIGRAGFAVPDLRSNRKSREVKNLVDGKVVYEGQMWLPEQMDAIRSWVETNKPEIDTLFFVSTVVFSHGVPKIENLILKVWFGILDLCNLMGKISFLRKYAKAFNDSVGDLRDDINDSWGADINAKETDRVLDFLFGLQNPNDGQKPINVVILSGDIHTPGHSMIYSADPAHAKKAVIPHVVATPVAYKQFPWAAEAIFRHLTKVVSLGHRKSITTRGEVQTYTAQISHHFCYRNVVVVSLRNYAEDESYVKIKYYLEGFPEPQIVLFDLIHSSRKEAIDWPEHLKVNKKT
ncbi:MAG TPA: alkaline phosphatase D family protein [Pyrinomonadaceae bacterium]|nr:alkaline phosphatase D family protein [Pyrinomonadaceae bacterium]